MLDLDITTGDVSAIFACGTLRHQRGDVAPK
jgi:hypothetical protein